MDFVIEVFMSLGLCITSTASGSVCGLNSYASLCDSLSRVECTCNKGYETDDGINCTSKLMIERSQQNLLSLSTDINECGNSTILCDQQCIDTDGSFVCDCDDGYDLQSDNRTCRGINNAMKW